ncbi:uncharacterized protein LOC130986532 [Salvia miltiorrhiza]|uniref:uncharacterized protein LOC130986532 n=1 Tax=Salvia miltiorrhiza TaxID=226208 RepID=UPI0025ABBB8A|nr:uncharacterized protein LOC130986532 [Salvia miltiorrhiza]
MEVLIPSQSAPSTPRRLGDYYFSAPTSPSHISQFYNDFDGNLLSPAAVPFDWEEKPGTPKSSSSLVDNGDDFAFDVISQDWDTASLSAEELFDGGVIKPLKPPPRLSGTAASPVRKQRSGARRIIQGAFSPRHTKSRAEMDPFAAAERGRERGVALSRPPSRRAARSFSPIRDHPQYLWGEEEKDQPPQIGKNSSNAVVCAVPSKGQKKWSLKDFFLFRSASEGRAADKDPLKKYTAAFRRSSFRVIDSPGSGPGSRRKGPVSAHELHYTVNRAVSEDLKRKTFLPYKQGILGRLAFNPAVHALANGFGFSRN